MSSKLTLIVAYGLLALSICVGFRAGYQLGRGYCFVRGGRKVERHKRPALFAFSIGAELFVAGMLFVAGILIIGRTGP
jgi:hypothetical protein